MELLNDTQALQALLEKDQKIGSRKGVVDTFEKDGYRDISRYTKRLIDMCKYEFQIEVAKALSDKIPEDHNRHTLKRETNRSSQDSGNAESDDHRDEYGLDEFSNEGNLSKGCNGVDESTTESWFFIGKPEIYDVNDIVIVVATKNFGDETNSKRYVGHLSKITKIFLSTECVYRFTFNEKISSSENVDVLMWMVENLTSYERVVDSLSDEKAMMSIPDIFLRAPVTDASPHKPDIPEVHDEIDESMNPAQKIAISKAIQSSGDNVVLIQGPPGCGKSTVITEMVRLLNRNTEAQVLVTAQTNVAVVDLAYKSITANKSNSEFERVIFMRPPKIIDSHKRSILEPFTVVARHHQIVNALLHVITREAEFNYKPIACHGSMTKDEVRTISRTDFEKCARSGLIELLPTKYGRNLFMSMIALPVDLTQIKRLIIGMRNELFPFFKREAFESLLQFCGNEQDANSKPIPIFGWIKQALLENATVVFCTINVGISVTTRRFLDNLAYIVVDEAAQALEPDLAALMCLDSCFRRLILVGDPNQLRGYCASNQGKLQMMDRSLMERLETYRLCHFSLLDVQYRMHQNIGDFVSKTFYDNRLTSDVSIHNRTAVTLLPPIMHVMILGSKMNQSKITTTSVVNIDEARHIVAHVFNVLLSSRQKKALVANPVTHLKSFADAAKKPSTPVAQQPAEHVTRQPAKIPALSIGIICIYKAQANVIRYLVNKKLSQNNYPGVDIVVNTIDSFQGMECDVIYVALTRTSQINTFMNSRNRVNVAISRARHHLIVVGDSNLLLADKKGASSSYWHKLCGNRNAMIINPKDLRNVPQYDGPEQVSVKKAVVISANADTTKKSIEKGLAAMTPIWTIHYERLNIGPKTPQGFKSLEYVIQTLASGEFDTGSGGRTTRPHFGKNNEGASLFFLTAVSGEISLAWTVKVHGERQVIEILGIGQKGFLLDAVWKSFLSDLKKLPEWKLSASMTLSSSGKTVDLSNDMPKNTSMFFVPMHIDIPAVDALADVPENGHHQIDPDHVKALSNMRSKPTMILGGGGTGKTECMLDMIEEQLGIDTDLDVQQLYLGATDSLANWSSMRLLKRESITDQNFSMVVFTSLPSLLIKLYVSNSKIHGRNFVGRSVFRSEYMDAMPEMVRSIGADELYDAIHARMDTVDMEMPSSTKSEHRTAYKVYESIKAQRGHIDAYDLHALVKKDPQRLVAMASKITRIYLDEVQDISWTMWDVIEIILSAGTSSVVCAGDFTQRVTPGIRINGIKDLIYKHVPKSMETTRLKTNHRSDANIISLANRIQSYTSMREHSMLPSPDPQESRDSVTLEQLHNLEDENPAEVLRNIGVPPKNYRAAIVTSSSWAHRLRESLGDAYNIFSTYECKGLEFDLVVCWDLFHASTDVKTSTIRRIMTTDKNTISEDEDFEMYLNHLYIAVTRARKHLIMVVPSGERSSIMIKALGINNISCYSEIKQNPRPEITIPVDERSVSDDLGMAIVMRERGLLQQALNIFEQYNDTAQAGFTKAQIHRNKHRLHGDVNEIQLCITECIKVVEILRQSVDNVLKIDDVKLFLAQTLMTIKQYALACSLFEELKMEDDLVACLIEAVESKSRDVVRLQSLVSEKAIAIWEYINNNERYARLVVALILVSQSSSAELVQSMLSHIPSKTGLVMMHNSLAEIDESVLPIWEVFQRRKSLQTESVSKESEKLEFLEWSMLRRLDGQHANQDLVSIAHIDCKSEFHPPMAYLFLGPRNNKTTGALSLHIHSGTLLKACQSLKMPIKHVATKMRELSCPLLDFMGLHSQITNGEESRMHLLVEAYKTHKLKMRGGEHQLPLFRWCAKMSGGTNVIEMICTMLREDKDMLLGVYNPDNTLNATQKALLQVLDER